MEKLAASLGSKMTGSSPETLNNLPGMEVIFFIIIIIFIIARGIQAWRSSPSLS